MRGARGDRLVRPAGRRRRRTRAWPPSSPTTGTTRRSTRPWPSSGCAGGTPLSTPTSASSSSRPGPSPRPVRRTTGRPRSRRCRGVPRHRQPEGGGVMNHLHRDLAPISDAGWDVIDEEAKSRLPTYLAARKLVDFERTPRAGPIRPPISAGSAEISGPSEGVSARRSACVLPLVELRTEFSRVADRARRRRPGHQQSRPGGARRGHPPDRPGRERHRLPRSRGRRHPRHHREHVARAHRAGGHGPGSRRRRPAASNALRQAGIGGPYGLAICPEHVHEDRGEHRVRRGAAPRPPAQDPGRPPRVGARHRGRCRA